MRKFPHAFIKSNNVKGIRVRVHAKLFWSNEDMAHLNRPSVRLPPRLVSPKAHRAALPPSRDERYSDQRHLLTETPSHRGSGRIAELWTNGIRNGDNYCTDRECHMLSPVVTHRQKRWLYRRVPERQDCWPFLWLPPSSWRRSHDRSCRPSTLFPCREIWVVWRRGAHRHETERPETRETSALMSLLEK